MNKLFVIGAVTLLSAMSAVLGADDSSCFEGGFAAYNAAVASTTAASTSTKHTAVATFEVTTRSKRTAATGFEPRIRSSLATLGSQLNSTKSKGLILMFK